VTLPNATGTVTVGPTSTTAGQVWVATASAGLGAWSSTITGTFGGFTASKTIESDVSGNLIVSTATYVKEATATGGLIFGDSSPDLAGEIGYDGALKYYDASALRTVVAQDVATGGNIILSSNTTSTTAGAVYYKPVAKTLHLYTDAAKTIAFLESPSFTTPGIGAATGTSLALGADPADAGAVRLSNNTNIAWEIAATGTDVTFGVNASDDMVLALVAATDIFQVTTGNFKVGSGTQTQTLNGDDAYVTGLLEVDGMIYADGGITGALTGNASTATALAANPADCGSNQFATSINASGTLGCAAIVDADIPKTITGMTLTASGLITASAGVTIADSQLLTFDESAANPNDADVTLSATDGVFTITSVNGDNNNILTVNVDVSATAINIASSGPGAAVGIAIDTKGAGEIALGSADAKFSLVSDALNITNAGAITGATTIAASTGIYIGSDPADVGAIRLSNATTIAWEDTTELTLTHVDNTGLLLNSTHQFQFGDSGTYINQSSDGVLNIASDTQLKLLINDEDINFTKTGADGITIGTNTGTAKISTALALASTGTITGGIRTKYLTAPGAVSGEDVYGTMIYMTTAGAITLPAYTAGMNLCVFSTGAYVVRIDPNGTDKFVLNGTALTAGFDIYSSGTAGDYICMHANTTSTWTTLGRSGTWTSGS